MKQTLLIVCEVAIIDKETNKLSLIGIFDNMSSPGTPVFSNFTIVTRFDDVTEQHDHKIIIRFESGVEVAKLEGKISFGPNKVAQYIGRFAGLPLAQFGEYKIEIYVDNILQPLIGSFILKKSLPL